MKPRMYCLLAIHINKCTDLSFQVSWSGSGNLVAITTNDSYFVLRFDRDAYTTAIESGAEISDEGVEEAIELVTEVADR